MYLPVRSPYAVGVETSSFNHIYAAQEKSMYCWAACLQMIFRKSGIRVSQKELAQLTCGVDRFGVPHNCPASFYTITQHLNTCWCDEEIEFCLSTKMKFERPNVNELYKELKNDNPVLVAYSAPGSSIGHAVLITAMGGYSLGGKIYATKIVVRDPWPDMANRLHQGYKVYNAAKFFEMINAHWIVSIEEIFQPQGWHI